MRSSAAFALASVLTLSVPSAAFAAKSARLDAAQIQKHLDKIVDGGRHISGALLAVRSPGLTYQGASGLRAKGEGPALAPDDEFRIASVTKVYTAAAVLRLAETGALSLDDRLETRISPESAALLRADGYDLQAMTLRQVLNHTSGLYDFATDPAFIAAVTSDPARLWTRREQVELGMTVGAPLFAPGSATAYSDTGYILLGEVIERASGLGFAEALPALLRFERLGLTRTYIEALAPGFVMDIPANRARQYQGDVETTPINPSFDIYGGGGLISTTDELARFFAALVGGQVFDNPQTLLEMLQTPKGAASSKADGLYGLGIKPMSLAGADCWGHFGHWGVVATACTDTGFSAAFTVNSASEEGYAAVGKLNALTDRLAKDQLNLVKATASNAP